MNTDLGTIYKLNIHIDGLPGTMDDVAFTCCFWTFKESITLSKEEMIRLDADNYIAVIDSTLIGRGTIKVQTTVRQRGARVILRDGATRVLRDKDGLTLTALK